MLKRFGDISFCLTQNTTQLSASERASVLLQHGFTEFVNITAPIKVTFKLQGNLTSKKSISELTGIIPYFYVFSGGKYFRIRCLKMAPATVELWNLLFLFYLF